MPGGYLNPWEPMRCFNDDPTVELNPRVVKEGSFVWRNNRYQCIARPFQTAIGEMWHLSIHTHDRGPVRNWRHLQQIKNEVVGENRTAVEVFPPERSLVDTSNEYHLWVFPAGESLGFGLDESLVSDDEGAKEFTDNPDHKGRQEPWEPGLTTGRTEASAEGRARYKEVVKDGAARA